MTEDDIGEEVIELGKKYKVARAQAKAWVQIYSLCRDLGILDLGDSGPHERQIDLINSGIVNTANLLKRLITAADLGQIKSPLILEIVEEARKLR